MRVLTDGEAGTGASASILLPLFANNAALSSIDPFPFVNAFVSDSIDSVIVIGEWACRWRGRQEKRVTSSRDRESALVGGVAFKCRVQLHGRRRRRAGQDRMGL